MYALSTITWFLILLAVWMICFAIIIPLSLVLWFMMKDLLTNDGMRIKKSLKSLYDGLGKMVQSQSQGVKDRLPIERTNPVTEERHANEIVNQFEESSQEVKEEPREKVSLEKEQHSQEEVVADKIAGIIYLDRQTSLTTDFPEDDESQ